MSVAYSRLTSTDLAEFRALNHLFGEVFEDRERYHNHMPSDGYLTSFLENDYNIVLIARDDKQIVGGLVAYVLDKFEQACKEVYLYDLAVATNKQRQGIGAGLLKELRHLTAALGAYILFVQADEGEPAVQFYEAQGPIENLRVRSFDFEPLPDHTHITN